MKFQVLRNAAVSVGLGLVGTANAWGAAAAGGMLVPLVKPVAAVGAALTYAVAPAGFAGGIAMAGLDLMHHSEIGRMGARGIGLVMCGGLALYGGEWVTMYGVTGALI